MNADVIANVFARLDPAIWLVTAASGPRRGGLIATFVNQASIVPSLPRVVIGVARQHHTWELIKESGAFGLHLLGEDHVDRVWRFGLRSGRAEDKLAGLKLESQPGPPLLADALAWLSCRVETALDTGDRTIFLGEVADGRVLSSASPLTVKHLLALAPAEKLHELKESLERDAKVDAAAIAKWRETKRTGV
jgi:flavin reductase (DIM6/NTAB) family NADH-FMN oxidoreductase RutF